jgi:hypothetical protein
MNAIKANTNNTISFNFGLGWIIGSMGLSELWFGPRRTHFWELGLTKSARESAGKLSHTSIFLPCAPEWGSLMIKGPLSKTSPSGDNGLDKANLWSHHCAQILIQNSTKTTLKFWKNHSYTISNNHITLNTASSQVNIIEPQYFDGHTILSVA